MKSGGKEAESEVKRKSAKAEHRKELMDPLLSMKQYVEAKKKSEDVSVKGSVSRPKTHSQVPAVHVYTYMYSCHSNLHGILEQMTIQTCIHVCWKRDEQSH